MMGCRSRSLMGTNLNFLSTSSQSMVLLKSMNSSENEIEEFRMG